MQPAGPVIPGQGERKTGKITNITLTAHLVDVEYSEAQVLLEKMKEDAKKA